MQWTLNSQTAWQHWVFKKDGWEDSAIEKACNTVVKSTCRAGEVADYAQAAGPERVNGGQAKQTGLLAG